jgi:hypothetical protein
MAGRLYPLPPGEGKEVVAAIWPLLNGGWMKNFAL